MIFPDKFRLGWRRDNRRGESDLRCLRMERLPLEHGELSSIGPQSDDNAR
jgi:hypothetical protein